jgi:hypothetical protein
MTKINDPNEIKSNLIALGYRYPTRPKKVKPTSGNRITMVVVNKCTFDDYSHSDRRDNRQVLRNSAG